jgi:hypothetical protein
LLFFVDAAELLRAAFWIVPALPFMGVAGFAAGFAPPMGIVPATPEVLAVFVSRC